MMWTRKLTTKAGLKSSVAGFARKEDGSMTIFAVFMFLMMLLVGGIGVDLMRNEMDRTRLQATVDRAVLAAADLDQPLDPDAVVRDYFDKAGMSQYLSSVTVEQGLNFRTVTANASTATPTQFMRIMGVEELPVPARGQAQERVSDVEISMVLDISGSMGWDSKMANLQTAAKTFVDTVINEANEDLISISLVPYTAQVNAGWDIFSELSTTHVHNYSYCVDFEVADFSLTGLELSNHTYEQMQHFDQGWNYSNPVSNPGCPKRDFEEIVAFSQDAESLKTTIGKYKARANTAIHLGMKWGVALLDPSFQPITGALNDDDLVDDVFANRPSEYSDPDTLKTVVLMTDGQNVDTQRIQPWYYNSSSEIVHWNKYPLHWYLNNYVSGYWSNWRYTKYTAAQADSMLANICTAAKDQGIVVWSVGFQVNDYSAGVMESCASSPSHFFRVEGVEITEAFEAIAK
ncbi:MAG: TadE/TadG family type IV pilus assembly protein, partial [Pseudomonadota bacterium]